MFLEDGRLLVVTSSVPANPIPQSKSALNGGGPDYDNAFVGAFYGTVDQALRPFAANPNAPVNQVGIYGGDACNALGVTGAEAFCDPLVANSLLSLNAINASGAETVGT